MARYQWLYYVVVFALGGWTFWYQWTSYLKKKRLRQKLMEEERLPKRKASPVWLVIRRNAAFLLVVAAIMVLVLLSFSRLEPIINSLWTWAVLFLAVFAFLFVQTAMKRDPAVTEAMQLSKSGDTAGAVAALRKSLTAYPTAERAGALGVFMFQQSQWQEACELFREAQRLDSTKPIFLASEAICLSKLGRSEEGLAKIEAARTAQPHEASLAYAAALMLAEMGRNDEAAEQLRQARELEQACEEQQQADLWTRGMLQKACQDKLDMASTRAFPVQVATTPVETPDEN